MDAFPGEATGCDAGRARLRSQLVQGGLHDWSRHGTGSARRKEAEGKPNSQLTMIQLTTKPQIATLGALHLTLRWSFFVSCEVVNCEFDDPPSPSVHRRFGSNSSTITRAT